MPFFELNSHSDLPLYRQIVEQIEQALREGQLQQGDKLPTVRELAQQLSAASGTVKRAYDELCRRGIIEMTQGKGTFIAPQDSPDSRKEKAVAAIEGMLDTLAALQFSPQEIQIFFDLKLRERLLREHGLRVAVVAQSPECLHTLTDRLYGLPGATIYPISLAELMADPAQLTAHMDLAVATDVSCDRLSAVLDPKTPLVRICLRLNDHSISSLARLPDGCRIGLLVQSQIFAQTARRACRAICREAVLQETYLIGSHDEIREMLQQCDALLVPIGFESVCTPEEQNAVQLFAQTHPMVRLELEPDQGSLRALEAALRREKDKNRFF